MTDEKKQIDELAQDLDTMVGNSSRLKAQKLYARGWRKQSVGEWVRDNEKKPYTCSNCRRFMTFQNLNFCPECGAKMLKGGE